MADPRPLYRHALASVIQQARQYEVVGEESGWEQALASARRLRPDIAILALNLPGLRERLPTDELLSHVIAERIVLVLDDAIAPQALTIIARGRCGYISTGWSGDQVLEALSASSERHPVALEQARRLGALTRREREVAGLVAAGATNAAIAQELAISLSTVKGHVAQIMRKLGTRNRAHIVARVLGHGQAFRPPREDAKPGAIFRDAHCRSRAENCVVSAAETPRSDLGEGHPGISTTAQTAEPPGGGKPPPGGFSPADDQDVVVSSEFSASLLPLAGHARLICSPA